MRQSRIDNELYLKHNGAGVLVCITTIYVDDFKIAGPHVAVHELVKVPEKESV